MPVSVFLSIPGAIPSVSMRNCPNSPRVPFTRQDVIALNMLDLNLPVPGAASMGGNDVVVSMHSIRCSINDSYVAPAMVTEVFTSALARASQAGANEGRFLRAPGWAPR